MIDTWRESELAGPRVFATTRWSVVAAAGEDGSALSQHALETLCSAYWHPIYFYVRRKGHGPDEARDLTQEFFSQLICKKHLRLADRHKGRFRSFLLATLDYFLRREWSRAHRQKRGGEFKFVSLEEQTSEEWSGHEPSDNDNPEKRFQRQWALTVLKKTMDALESECAAHGKEALFREVKKLLSGERDGMSYLEIGKRLELTEGTVRVSAHRLRQRYGELLRDEVAKTVGASEDVEEELHDLLRVLSE